MTTVGLPKNAFLSLVAVAASFLGSWGICIMVALAAGGQITTAFPHRILFLVATAALQGTMIASDPIRSNFQIWLRVCVVAGGIAVSSEIFREQLINLKLIDMTSSYLWIAISVLFALGMCAYLFASLKKRMSDSAIVM